jgi:hypothetical protein
MAYETQGYDSTFWAYRIVYIVILCLVLICESVYSCKLSILSYHEGKACHPCIPKAQSSRVLLLHVYPFLPGWIPCQYHAQMQLNFLAS